MEIIGTYCEKTGKTGENRRILLIQRNGRMENLSYVRNVRNWYLKDDGGGGRVSYLPNFGE